MNIGRFAAIYYDFDTHSKRWVFLKNAPVLVNSLMIVELAKFLILFWEIVFFTFAAKNI